MEQKYNDSGAVRVARRIGKEAPSCPKCGAKTYVQEIEINSEDEIIATFACRSERCEYARHGIKFYRRMATEAAKKLFAEIPKEEAAALIREERAAEAAKIPCGHCGELLRHIRTKIVPGGKVVHEFKCENPRCLSLLGKVQISFCESDIEKIERRAAAKKWVCPVCGREERGATVICKYRGGEICAEHCEKCEYRDKQTSTGICMHPNGRKKSRRE